MKSHNLPASCTPSTTLGMTSSTPTPTLTPAPNRPITLSSHRLLILSPLPPFILFFLLFSLTLSAQTLPAGYILQYRQNFTAATALNDFWFSRASLWSVSLLQGNSFLHSDALPFDYDQSDTNLAPLVNRAVIRDRIFGDFVLEADIRLPEGSNEQAAVILDMKDSTRYYYIRLSADSAVTPGIFLVKGGNISRLPLRISNPFTLKAATWHKIRVERNIVNRTIRVYVGNMSLPVMETRNYELVMGYIGFAAAGGAVRFDNIGVWAPTVIDESEK